MAPPPSIAGTAEAPGFLDLLDVTTPRISVAVPDTVLRGIGLIVLSTVFFSAGDVVAKFATATLPAVEVTWMRYVVFAMLVVPAAFLAHGRRALATARPSLQALRALAVVGSSVLFMEGVQHLQVAEATAINFLSPIFITALSIPFLGEKVGLHRWAAAGLGFLGVMLVVRPGSDAFQMAALYPVASAMVWSVAAITTRMMSSERPELTLAWSALIGLAALSLLVPFVWRTPNLHEIGFGILTGVFSTMGHWLLVRGYRLAPASVLAPFSYVQLLFAGLLGFAAFGIIPGIWTVAGGLVIAASGLYTAHRERVRAVRTGGAAAAHA